MARQGQSMSASTYVADVTEKQVKLIHDKESEFDKSILFSDGCGYISQDLLQIAADIHDFKKVSAL